VASDSVTPRDCLMHPGQQQKRINEDESPHLAASRPEVFDTVGKPLPTSFAENVNPKVIQERMGHATMAETMDTYGHLFPDAEDLGRGAVDKALGNALAEQERNRAAQ
jgi:hypothetical protein